MTPMVIDARWDREALVWLGTSADVPGLVVEASTWPELIEETRLVLPDLLALGGASAGPVSITFRAEEQLELEQA